MGISLSPIRAVQYQILKSHYEVLDVENPKSEADDFNIKFSPSDLERQEDGFDKLEAFLDVCVSPSGDESSGYKIHVVVRGMFAAKYSEEGGSKKDFELFLSVNAFNLLYAFIRSHVQMLTSISPSDQVCLPCLDVNSIADMIANEEKNTD